MKRFLRHCLIYSIFLLSINKAFADSVIMGINLELVGSKQNTFDGGLGLTIGYEFSEFNGWNYGGQLSYLNGWNEKQDLIDAGDVAYNSMSLYATARHHDLPIMFKAGIVDTDYQVLLIDNSQIFQREHKLGAGIGMSLAFEFEPFVLELLDYKRIWVGNTWFNSYGISITVPGLFY